MRALSNPVRIESPERGLDGRTTLAGARAPLMTDGRIGDFWIDKVAKKLYGPKTAAAWPDNGLIRGPNGWTALTRVVADGTRRVREIYDWIGGEGTKPALGYEGSIGIVPTIAEAQDYRGPEGPQALINALDAATADIVDDELVATGKANQDNKKRTAVETFDLGGELPRRTVAHAQASSVRKAISTIRTRGFSDIKDGGGAHYTRVNAEPSHGGKFRTLDRWTAAGNSDSANGGWWELAETTISPEAFGAIGNGTFDNYTAFSAMVAYVNETKSATINMKRGADYYVDRFATATNGITDFQFWGCNGLRINGNGSKISLKGNFNRDVLATRGLCGFFFVACKNIAVDGLEVNGNVQATTRVAALGEAASYGLVFSSCMDVQVTNCFLHHMATDGLSIRESTAAGSNPRLASRRFFVSNVRGTYNARMGLSIISLRTGNFVNCDFSYTGRAEGAYGTHSPACGVDIEPNRNTATAAPNQMDVNCGDIIFDNFVIEENVGGTLIAGLYASIDTVRIQNSRLICADNGVVGGGDGFILDVPAAVVDNCYFDMRSKYLYLGFAANDLADVTFTNNTVRGKSSRVVASLAAVRVTVKNNRFISYNTTPIAASGDYTFNFGNSKLVMEDNYFFIPATCWANRGSTDRCPAALATVTASRRNRFETDLLGTAGVSSAAHFFTGYGASTLVEDDVFVGTNRGPADTFRPELNSTYDTLKPYSLLNMRAAEAIVIGRKDAAVRVTTGTALPTTGKYKRGDQHWKQNATAGQSPGWVAVTDGDNAVSTAGWKAMAALSA